MLVVHLADDDAAEFHLNRHDHLDGGNGTESFSVADRQRTIPAATVERLTAAAADGKLAAARLARAVAAADRDRAAGRAARRLTLVLPADTAQVRFGFAHRGAGRAGGDTISSWPVDRALFALVADAADPVIALLIERTALLTTARHPTATPADVLTAINRAVLALDLPDAPVASVAVVRVDGAWGTASVARSAGPTAIRLSATGPAGVWGTAGPLLGLFDAPFSERTDRFAAGDVILLATDGVDAAKALAATVSLRGLAPRPFADAVAAATFPPVPEDDCTVMAVGI